MLTIWIAACRNCIFISEAQNVLISELLAERNLTGILALEFRPAPKRVAAALFFKPATFA